MANATVTATTIQAAWSFNLPAIIAQTQQPPRLTTALRTPVVSTTKQVTISAPPTTIRRMFSSLKRPAVQGCQGVDISAGVGIVPATVTLNIPTFGGTVGAVQAAVKQTVTASLLAPTKSGDANKEISTFSLTATQTSAGKTYKSDTATQTVASSLPAPAVSTIRNPVVNAPKFTTTASLKRPSVVAKDVTITPATLTATATQRETVTTATSPPEITFLTNGQENDGYWVWIPGSGGGTGGGLNNSDVNLRSGGWSGAYYHSFIRFTNVPIPTNKRVVNAKLKLFCSTANSATHRVYLVKRPSPPVIDTDVNAENKPLTTNYTEFVSDTYGEIEIDITAALQEVVDQILWKPGYALVVMIRGAAVDGQPQSVRSNFYSSETSRVPGGYYASISIQTTGNVNHEVASGGTLGGGTADVVKLSVGNATLDGSGMAFGGGIATTSVVYNTDHPVVEASPVPGEGGGDGGYTGEETAIGGAVGGGAALLTLPPVVAEGGAVCGGLGAKGESLTASGGARLGGVAIVNPLKTIKTISSQNDDGFMQVNVVPSGSAGYLHSSETSFRVGFDHIDVDRDEYDHGFLRFTNVPLTGVTSTDKNIDIVNARLSLMSTQTITAKMRIYGVKQINPATITGYSDFKNRPLTTAYVDWEQTFTHRSQPWVSPDLTVIVKELVNASGWHSGLPLMFILMAPLEEGGGSTGRARFGTQEGGEPAQLTIEYFRTVEVSTSGGAVGGGEAVASLGHIMDVSGGCICGGTSPVNSGIMGTGGAICGSDTTAETVDFILGSGGAKCGGRARLGAANYHVIAEGGAVCGGTGHRIYNETATGGCIVGQGSGSGSGSGSTVDGAFSSAFSSEFNVTSPSSGPVAIVSRVQFEQGHNGCTCGGTHVFRQIYNGVLIKAGVVCGGRARQVIHKTFITIISGVGRTFTSDNAIKSYEAALLRGNRLPLTQVLETEIPALPQGTIALEQFPTWCDAAEVFLAKPTYNSPFQECDGIIPAVVKKRQGIYLPAKKRSGVQPSGTTIARLY